MIHSAQISYIISIDGSVVANITCLSGTTFILQCSNNIWNNYTSSMCDKLLSTGKLKILNIICTLK